MEFNAKEQLPGLIDWMRQQMKNCGGKTAVLGISGGKDSMLLAKLMQMLQRRSDFPFEVKFLVMDPGYTPENRQRILDNAALLDIPVTLRESEIFRAVEGVEKNPCYLCARMRRGCLYAKAQELGGLVSGEHGIGYAKKEFLKRQYGETPIALMQGIKRVFDEKNILNPGKICF